MVTTVSLIFGVLSLYYLVIDDVVMFGVCFLLSYYFDCMDGTMARRYSMETKFGDIYDHTTDVFVIIGIICIGVAKFHKHITLTHVLIICFFLVMCQIHIGCQQQLYQLNKATHYYDDEILDDVKKLCTKPENIYITKYFGIGTCVLLMFMYIMYLNLLNNQKI
jgi:phosphatidylserine synthase